MEKQPDKFSHLQQLADSIVAMFGNNCEVVLHDLSDLNHSVIYISGDVTGRSVGAPATDLLVRTMNEDPDLVEDIYNYSTTAADGRSIKSSTCFLKNETGEVYGAFCINLDTTDYFVASKLLSSLIQTENNTAQESFTHTAGETVEELFKQCIDEMGKHPKGMSPQERSQLVERLHNRGVFRIKGAVNSVAQLTGVSKFTIYNHIKSLDNSD